MMNRILPAMFILSFASAIFTGRMSELSSAVASGGTAAIELIFNLIAAMCFWGGIMEVAERSGITSFFSRLVSPLLKLLFPRIRKERYVLEAISMNVTANMLGLGNAATPLGLEAMKRLQLLNNDTDRASDEMVVFVVMNTAAMHIIPTTVATMRGQYGSADPMEIMPAAFLTSFCALMSAIIAAKTGNRIYRKRQGKR